MKSDQKIFFGSKEENSKRRQDEFLSNSPYERFLLFLRMAEEMRFFETVAPHPNSLKDNFIIE
jgi:hypothetical protein